MTPPTDEAHVHEWKREYAPNYRQASEANDWTETCACGAIRSGTDEARAGEPEIVCTRQEHRAWSKHRHHGAPNADEARAGEPRTAVSLLAATWREDAHYTFKFNHEHVDGTRHAHDITDLCDELRLVPIEREAAAPALDVEAARAAFHDRMNEPATPARKRSRAQFYQLSMDAMDDIFDQVVAAALSEKAP